ncbi:MAG: nucleotidyl transferase AbiEii/AbiGii toxin family protein [Polaromonas sp.]
MKTVALLSTLVQQPVDFVLVGGMAVQLHGYMRMTYDVDLVLAMNNDNLTRFIDAARQLGLAPVIPVPIDSLKNAELIDQWHKEKGMLAFALREPGIAGSVIDVLVRPDVSYERLVADAFNGELFGNQVKVASIDHLLEMKRVANRPKDLLDIAALEKIKRGEDPNG